MISDTHFRILTFVNRLYYTTAEQVRRRYYADGSLTTVQTRLKEMSELEYLHRIEIKSWPAGGGSYPYFYSVGRRGRGVLQEHGISPSEIPKSSKQDNLSGLFLNHTLKVNEVLIAAELLEEYNGVEIHEKLHERSLRRRFRGAHPDLYLYLASHGWGYPLLFEIDNGTIDGTRMRRKIADLVEFYRNPFQRAFGHKETRIVINTPNLKRTRIVLTSVRLEAKAFASLFLVGHNDPEHYVEFFVSPKWVSPSSGELVSLIEQ